MSTAPRLSFVVPASPKGAPLVLRFLRSLTQQTAPRDAFEVVIGADGGDDGSLARVAALIAPTGVQVRIVDTPRGAEKDLPHRNHARNGAIRAARGDYLWVVDCDFIWEPQAVAHAITLLDDAAAAGKCIALSPILMALAEDPVIWLAHSEAWAKGEEQATVAELVGRNHVKGGEYSGFDDLRRKGAAAPQSMPKQIPEGFPCAHRDIFRALGGFNEGYIGWGGNKEELCRRINALRGEGLTYEVIRTVTAYHQPHPADAHKTQASALRRMNQQRMTTQLQEMEGGASWWQEQVNRAREVITSIQRKSNPAALPPAPVPKVKAPTSPTPAAPKPAPPAPPRAPVVGIITLTDERKGIVRDVEIIAEVIGKPRPGRTRPDVRLFHVQDVQRLKHPAQAVDEKGGRVTVHVNPVTHVETFATFPAWVNSVDVVVISEMLPIAAIEHALTAGKRVVYLPNADWSCIDGDVQAWLAAVKRLAANRAFTVVAKTLEYARLLKAKEIPCTYVPWIAPDPVVRDREPHIGPVRFLASLGMGGWNKRRGADVIVEAWRLLKADASEAVLTVKTIRPLADQLDGAPIPEGIKVKEGMWSRAEVAGEWSRHDAVLYPTRWDGFGLSLSEALNAGLPCLAPNAWPMNEQVRDGHNGLLIAGEVVGRTRLAPHVEPTAQGLADAMRRLIDDRALLARITAPHPGERIAQQTAMAYALQHAIIGWAPPRALIVHMDGKGPDKRRSEHYWKAALEAHGVKVETCARGKLASMPVLDVDFALVAKISVEDVVQVRRIAGKAPVICWHHDLTDYNPSRWHWQVQLARAVDLTLIPEGELERFGNGVRVRTLMPGTKAGLERSTAAPKPPTGRVVFLGSCDGPGDERVTTVKQLLDAGAPVDVYGPVAGWSAVGIECRPYVADDAARAAYEGALALCVSRGGHKRPYTSNRLFNAAGAGAIPLVMDFPGLSDLYPHGTVIPFGGEGLVKAAQGAIGDPVAMARVQRKATAHTWRHHTWHDRVGLIIGWADKLAEASGHRSAMPEAVPGGLAWAEMWEKRAQTMGRRAVGHVKHNDAQCKAQISEWWKRLGVQVSSRLKDYETNILDYGCGVGRFTPLLNGIPGKTAYGVDVSPRMVEMAKEGAPSVDFRVVSPRALPFPDGFFHCLWTCTVLQHVPDAEIEATVRELRRVATRGALVVLFENTNNHGKRTSGSGHVVFRRELEYRHLFPGVVEVGCLQIEGETHSIMVGRLP